MKGLGLYTPHRGTVASLTAPLTCSIHQAFNGISLKGRRDKVLVAPYLHNIFCNWRNSSLLIFTSFQKLSAT
eukprot:15360644-Ditylum_brightwellii.AAC.1